MATNSPAPDNTFIGEPKSASIVADTMTAGFFKCRTIGDDMADVRRAALLPKSLFRRTRVYIAGPISKGDVEANVRKACAMATALISAGYSVLCPHLTAYLQSPVASLSAGFNHETWMEVDKPWVEVADVLFRMEGESSGADQEVMHALASGVPVVYSIAELQRVRQATVAVPAREAKKVSSSPSAGDPRFHAILRDMAALHDRKQADYGSSADPFANVRSSEAWGVPPWQGAMIRACDKIKRLQSFAVNGSLANEGVEDSLIDLANYAVIALVLWREEAKAQQSDNQEE